MKIKVSVIQNYLTLLQVSERVVERGPYIFYGQNDTPPFFTLQMLQKFPSAPLGSHNTFGGPSVVAEKTLGSSE